MKPDKKKKIFKFIFYVFFISFLAIYLSELTGYYEYKNHEKAVMTEEQIKKFEDDVKNGKEVDINKYLVVEETKYNNNLSKLTSKISQGISKAANKSVESSFKFLSKLVGE